MAKGLKLKYEQREALNDVKNLIISYTPVSGFIDTAKFINKWFFRRRVTRRLGRKVNRRYRMFVLSKIARKYGGP